MKIENEKKGGKFSVDTMVLKSYNLNIVLIDIYTIKLNVTSNY